MVAYEFLKAYEYSKVKSKGENIKKFDTLIIKLLKRII